MRQQLHVPYETHGHSFGWTMEMIKRQPSDVWKNGKRMPIDTELWVAAGIHSTSTFCSLVLMSPLHQRAEHNNLC